MKTQQAISVWVVEDNELFRQSLVAIVNDQQDMNCVGVFSSCEEVLASIRFATIPDVVLHDIGFVGMSGILCVEAIKKEYPEVQIIMITVYDDADHIFESLRVGATGYLLKSSTEEKIVTSIREVVEGGSPMNSSIARKVVEFTADNQEKRTQYSLSAREREILELLIKGLSNNLIAEKLHISFHTVDTHIRKIYNKLHVHSRAEAATKVVKEKLVKY